MNTPVFDVSGAVAVLNQTLDYALPTMTVVGELANYKIAKNRWVYGDIKDDGAKLRLFGTIYDLPGPLSDGMMIEVLARPQIHPQFGFSLNIIAIKPVGEGSIKKAANLLAQKLESEGLFDPARKRPVPYPPQRVGLIGSTQSAAYADFIKILNARWQGVDVDVYESQVQGDAAVEQLVSGLQYFGQRADVDVVVMIRGGGSADDLAAFSVEQVVREVASSRIPTCVAIGHEIDESLAELAADMRASTPSNAAELLFPDKSDMQDRLRMQHSRLAALVDHHLESKATQLASTRSDLVRAVEATLDEKLQHLQHAASLLEAIHPKTTLKRGYALVQSSDGKLVGSRKRVRSGDTLSLTFADGKVDATAKN